MTPNELAEYLKVFKDARVASAYVELPGGIKMSAVFGPEPFPDLDPTKPVGNPEPGGWKGTVGLDESQLETIG